LQYVIYFIAGGGLVVSVAYLNNRGNPLLTALVGNIPVIFLLNIFLVYQVGGLAGSLTYAKSALLLIPVFTSFVILTIWLLPQVGMPKALLPGMTAYLVPVIISQARKHALLKRAVNHKKSLDKGQDKTNLDVSGWPQDVP